MTLEKIDFVYVDVEYLKYLHSVDSQVQFNKDDPNYKIKPHVGILINENGTKYVIPLTSAKEAHRELPDVGDGFFKIYELIDMTRARVDGNDIITEIRNQEVLELIDKDKRQDYKQRLLSLLDVRKMIPVKSGVYQKVTFRMSGDVPKEEQKRMKLMLKEHEFINRIKNDILTKANKLYQKQIRKGKVFPYHCNYKKLEQACKEYKC